ADPPGAERHYAERLVRLPEVAWCYGPPAEAPAVGPPPAGAAGAVTFAALNNPAKMTEPAVDLWCRVLEAVPGSRRLLLGGLVARTPEEYVATAARWASDPGRLRAVRAGLREQFRRSPVCDAVRYTRHLEDAFRALWRERVVIPCHTGSDFSLRPAHR